MINKSNSLSKALRILSIFERLNQGAVIKKGDEAKRFNVTKKTIQRDIEDLRAYFSEIHPYEGLVELVYQRDKGGYLLKRESEDWLTNQEILVLSKVLLESRAFTKEEMDKLLNKLILQSAPEEYKHIKEVISNERFHYNPVQHRRSLFETIWDLSKAIREKKIIEIDYRKCNSKQSSWRQVKPVGIIFSEFYFYLTAYICEYDLDHPTIYRLDRIEKYESSKEKFHIPYAERFEEGEFRKRIQFMYSGELMKLKFSYAGPSLEAVLDRLPTAEVVEEREGSYIIEAEVYGRGVKMWLLSQAQYIEVLEPEAFREDMESTIAEMLGNYR
ncbi:helix-turn-helix transcriptional regulator [Fuchsiella alkaliacetigena]|uniref:helix-turn-helix transcriptional regulator n=1 Tax=Fuchsiella alkaliacetigena TaxID=957042 RepID=UPI00200B736A|nr:WYL domain-containing protein [Fuchsiella alkaliacetigena]MCK8823447.1 WYL domain-containing protein [Fuchsiella alkaliacetigena]